jgi:hypothetical protein
VVLSPARKCAITECQSIHPSIILHNMLFRSYPRTVIQPEIHRYSYPRHGPKCQLSYHKRQPLLTFCAGSPADKQAEDDGEPRLGKIPYQASQARRLGVHTICGSGYHCVFYCLDSRLPRFQVPPGLAYDDFKEKTNKGLLTPWNIQLRSIGAA